MWAGIAVIFVIALIAVSFAAGGAWLIIAVPLAVLVLAPFAFARFWPRRANIEDLRDHAQPAVTDSRQAEDTVVPPDVP